MGLILSVNRWIRLLTNTLAERLCRRYNLALLFGLSLTVGAMTTAAYGLFSSFTVLLIARMVWGLSWSFIRQIGLTTVTDTAARPSLGRVTGFYNGVSRVGSVAGNLGGGVFTDLIGYTSTLLVFAVVSLLGVPLGAAARRGIASHPAEHVPRAKVRGEGAGLFLCGVVTGCVGPGMMMSTLGMVLKETVGETVTFAGLAIGVATLNGLLLASRWVTDGIGAPLMGALSDRIGRRHSSLIFYGAGTAALVAASLQTTGVGLSLAVLAFFVSGVGTTVTNLTEANSRSRRAVAAYVTASDFGAATGPMLGWMALQIALPTDSIFLIGAGLYLAGALASRWGMGAREV